MPPRTCWSERPASLSPQPSPSSCPGPETGHTSPLRPLSTSGDQIHLLHVIPIPQPTVVGGVGMGGPGDFVISEVRWRRREAR